MRIRLRQNFTPRLFTKAQLEAIAEALVISVEGTGVRPVYWGVTQPADTSIPWQPTDEIGNPVGPVRFYNAGGWR